MEKANKISNTGAKANHHQSLTKRYNNFIKRFQKKLLGDIRPLVATDARGEEDLLSYLMFWHGLEQNAE